MRGRLHQLKVKPMLIWEWQFDEETLCVTLVPCTCPRWLVRTATVDEQRFLGVG